MPSNLTGWFREIDSNKVSIVCSKIILSSVGTKRVLDLVKVSPLINFILICTVFIYAVLVLNDYIPA